jgi:hypothetical protein
VSQDTISLTTLEALGGRHGVTRGNGAPRIIKHTLALCDSYWTHAYGMEINVIPSGSSSNSPSLSLIKTALQRSPKASSKADAGGCSMVVWLSALQGRRGCNVLLRQRDGATLWYIAMSGCGRGGSDWRLGELFRMPPGSGFQSAAEPLSVMPAPCRSAVVRAAASSAGLIALIASGVCQVAGQLRAFDQLLPSAICRVYRWRFERAGTVPAGVFMLRAIWPGQRRWRSQSDSRPG